MASKVVDRLAIESTVETVVLGASFAQQRLWFLDQLHPQSSAYNLPWTVRLIGALDAAALNQSLTEIVRRHEVLRTTFRLVDGQLMQIIAPAGELTLPITDLCLMDPLERAPHVTQLVTEEARVSFDLSRGPLMRARLIRTGEMEHVLVVVKHHMITEDWSEGVFTSEMIAAYEAFSEGGKPDLPALPIQYADFAQWQRERLEAGPFDGQLAYWRRQLADVVPTEHPTRSRRPMDRRFSGRPASFKMPPEHADALKNLGRGEQATLFVTLLTAFKVLLLRLGGREDIVVGSPVANRSSPELKDLIGFFVNTVVLRTKLENNLTFRTALGRVRETVLEARPGAGHHTLDLPRIERARQPVRECASERRRCKGDVGRSLPGTVGRDGQGNAGDPQSRGGVRAD